MERKSRNGRRTGSKRAKGGREARLDAQKRARGPADPRGNDSIDGVAFSFSRAHVRDECETRVAKSTELAEAERKWIGKDIFFFARENYTGVVVNVDRIVN